VDARPFLFPGRDGGLISVHPTLRPGETPVSAKKHELRGAKIEKGDELGMFEFGGSSNSSL